MNNLFQKMTLSVLMTVLLSFFALTQNTHEIEKLLMKEKLAGAVWTLVKNDSIYTFSAGYKNLVSKEKLQSTDRIHVGSITKSILALGVLSLDSKGTISIDEPIKKYIPNLPIQNPWEATNTITVRHLLDHTSGLSDLRLWHFFSSSSKPDTPLSEFYANHKSVLKVQAKPGELFSYSNIGYALLGMLIEEVTKQPYEKYLDENLLQPIGMYQSTFRFVSQVGNAGTDKLAMGHFDDGTIALALPIYLRPAAQFTTTANDMGKLITFYLNKGKVEGNQIIDAKYFDAMGSPNYTEATTRGVKSGYALGISLRDRHGVLGYAHSGNIVGFRAMLYIFPQERKGFFISHNMDSETADYESFNQTLIENLNLQKPKPSPIGAFSTKEYSSWQGYYVPKITKIEPFKLLDWLGSFTKVTLKEEGMLITPFQKNSAYVTHLGNGIFQSAEKIQPSHVLYQDDAGEKYLSTGLFTVRKISGWILLLVACSVILGLLGLFGLLMYGTYSLFRFKSMFLRAPVFLPFLALVLLIFSGILIGTKNIIYIGDFNTGSLTLYVSSILLPIFCLLSFGIFIRHPKKAFQSFGFWFVCALLQVIILFACHGLIPFASWQ